MGVRVEVGLGVGVCWGLPASSAKIIHAFPWCVSALRNPYQINFGLSPWIRIMNKHSCSLAFISMTPSSMNSRRKIKVKSFTFLYGGLCFFSLLFTGSWQMCLVMKSVQSPLCWDRWISSWIPFTCLWVLTSCKLPWSDYQNFEKATVRSHGGSNLINSR